MGLIGGSIAKGLKQRVPATVIASIDRDLDEASRKGAVDILFTTLAELIDWAELIILASPLSTLSPLAKEIAELCPKEKKLLVIDVGSVKAAVFPCFETLTTENLEFLSTHPMAGKELGGFANSEPNLFQDCCWILSPHAKNTSGAIEMILRVVKSLGATPTSIDPKKHDRQVALISHLPALLSRSLMRFVQKADPESLTIAGPGFKSMTRLSHDNPQMQREIGEFNREEIAKQLELFFRIYSGGQMTKDSMVSATVAINSMAMEKKARGETVYNFAAGDPILPSHARVIEAVEAEMRTEMILYPPVAGIPELRQCASQWMNENYATSFTEENTIVTAGGKFALFAAIQLLLKEGDEVLIPCPYWVSYPQIVKLFKGHPVILPTIEKNQWKLTPEILKQHITANSKILILNNAGNPTGNLYSKEELKTLLDMAAEYNIFVISDEVYSRLVYDDHQFFSCGALTDQVLVIQSCSKNFAMTGWRIGFGFGPKRADPIDDCFAGSIDNWRIAGQSVGRLCCIEKLC